MEQMILGKTGLKVGRTGFGAIPIQRVSYEESTAILRRAYESGVTLYDTANGYTTSEDRIGTAFCDVRDKVVLCTKSGAKEPDLLMKHIENSLKMLRTDYIDIFQFHNPGFVPRPGGGDGLYDCVVKAKEQGKVRFISLSSHRLNVASEAVKSGLYDTLQFPFSYISSEGELALIDVCRENNVGILAMKGLCGGLLTNAKAAFAFLRQYENIVPIWGIQEMWELEEFISYEKNPPAFDDEIRRAIGKDKAELSSNFCRACGYCLPCPADIPIPMAARMSYLLGRMRRDVLQGPEWQENMRRIDDCTACGHCTANCPYELDTPKLLKEHQEFYLKEL